MSSTSSSKRSFLLLTSVCFLALGSQTASAETMPADYWVECYAQLFVSQYEGLNGNKLADPTRHLYVTDAQGGALPVSLDTSTLVNFTNCDATSTRLAINLRKAWDYYKNIFGRTGFDNKNSNMMAYMNTATNTAESDGGTRLSFSNNCVSCMEVLDIVAHEFTHSVLGQTTSFYGGKADQSQALNESLASIFGLAVHNYWFVDNSYVYGGNIEDMRNPRISHMDFYDTGANADPHINGNGGVIAKAAYLLSEGGWHSYSKVSVNGVGRGKMERILYYTMTNNDNANRRLTSTATFQQFAEAAYQAAKDLYPTERETHASVYWAFKAVGVHITNFDDYVGDGVYVYEHMNYQGRWYRLTSYKSSLGGLGFNDVISSVKVIGNYRCRLWEHINRTGASLYITSSQNLPSNWNDLTSSVEVWAY